jgi:hypothetical protein
MQLFNYRVKLYMDSPRVIGAPTGGRAGRRTHQRWEVYVTGICRADVGTGRVSERTYCIVCIHPYRYTLHACIHIHIIHTYTHTNMHVYLRTS